MEGFMYSVSYDDIYSNFLSRVQAYDLVEEFTEEYALEMMDEWLKSVKSNPRVRKLFSSITLGLDENNDKIIQYELNTTIDEESDNDFVRELFALGISYKWVEPKYKSVLNTSQFFGGKEVKFFSQSNHMTELKEMYKSSKLELANLIRDRGYYNNSYLGNV